MWQKSIETSFSDCLQYSVYCLCCMLLELTFWAVFDFLLLRFKITSLSFASTYLICSVVLKAKIMLLEETCYSTSPILYWVDLVLVAIQKLYRKFCTNSQAYYPSSAQGWELAMGRPITCCILGTERPTENLPILLGPDLTRTFMF